MLRLFAFKGPVLYTCIWSSLGEFRVLDLLLSIISTFGENNPISITHIIEELILF